MPRCLTLPERSDDGARFFAMKFSVTHLGRAMLLLSRLIPRTGNVLSVERRIGEPIDIAARWELRPPE